jgi:biopolymer transport protein ExbB
MEEPAINQLQGDIWTSTQALLELGGPVVAVLMIISVFGFAIALYKFFQFSSLSPGRFAKLHEALDQWSTGSAKCIEMLEKSPLGLGLILQFGLENRDSPDTEELREELARRATNFLQPYGRYMRPLELIYYLAPVLGLLGTVLGMIEAFRGLESSAGMDNDSTALAGGIWEALLTTAVGLSIAIPFTVVHAWLETRLDNATASVSDLLTRVMTINVGAKSQS